MIEYREKSLQRTCESENCYGVVYSPKDVLCPDCFCGDTSDDLEAANQLREMQKLAIQCLLSTGYLKIAHPKGSKRKFCIVNAKTGEYVVS